MLTQIIPPVARVAVLFNPTTAPFAGLMLRVIEESAASLAVAVRAAPCHDDAETEVMMTGLAREEGAGLLVLPENFAIVHRHAIITLAARYRLPAVYPYRFFTTSGGLMSYGIDPNGPPAATVSRLPKAPVVVSVLLLRCTLTDAIIGDWAYDELHALRKFNARVVHRKIHGFFGNSGSFATLAAMPGARHVFSAKH